MSTNIDEEFNAIKHDSFSHYTPLKSLSEAYFGKPKKCLEMEKCIAKLKEKYQSQLLTFGNIEGSDEWKRLKSLIEEQFGFYSISLILVRDQMPNAYTFPITMTFDGCFKMAKYARVDKQGFMYDPKYKVCTLFYITDSLLFNSEFTPGEIVAILMHEIGHNFDVVCYNHLVPFILLDLTFDFFIVLYQNPLAITQFFTAFTGLRHIHTQITNFSQGGMLWLLGDTLAKLASIPVGLIEKIAFPVLRLVSKFIGTVYTLISPLSALYITYDGYSKENFADKFASMHGYGPELVSGLGKLDTEYNNLGVSWLINRIPLVAHLFAGMDCCLQFFGTGLDPHPEYAARVMNTLKIIESDLNDKHIDPKTREQAKKDIARIKKNCQEYLDDVEDKNSFGDDVYKAYQQTMFEWFPGNGDMRSGFLDGDNINDNAINAAIKHNIQRANRSSNKYNKYFENANLTSLKEDIVLERYKDKTSNPLTRSSRLRKHLPAYKPEGYKTRKQSKDPRLNIGKASNKAKLHKGF